MSKELSLTKPEPTVGDMLHAVIERGVTQENVGALEKLAELYERMEAKRAEREFAVAFNALQSEMPVIVASSEIPNRGKYERFEDIMRIVGPLLIKHGFSVAFEQSADDKRIKVTCNLRHVSGHSVPTSFAVRLGGRADSDTQADCKASTTARRNALTQALNIVIRQDCLNDEDATLEGGTVTSEQAFELERRVAETNTDKVKFLAYAGAKTFAEIAANKYSLLDENLKRKEKSR